MSVDFVVFDPTDAPREAAAFRQWYADVAEWRDGESNFDPKHSSPALQNWYAGMTGEFPNLNLAGEDAHTDDRWVDYSFGRHVIQVGMTSRHANEAWALAKAKAADLGLGTYDCMSDDGRNNRTIVFPDGPLQNEPSFFAKLFGKMKG